MPSIYLSPSTQEFNPYIIGGNEEYYMNLIADAMEPYLYASGISFTRNTPDMTAASSIAASNMGNYDLHLALHSNASNTGDGSRKGSEVYYYPTSVRGRRAAEIIANNLKLLSGMLPSFDTQIKKAEMRDDLVSVNHRVTEFLASYFDILFALNEMTHPGEKRMQSICRTECKILPNNFEENF